MSLKQPVQYPVKHYSHLDAGAPQLADIDGNIKTILKACLVTGIGGKAAAGWTSLFEDDFRIVLRRPLRSGNPPDIKIENGIINGLARHRIVSQDNPTGLDDATELAAANLLSKDSLHGSEWHLIASDFGFMLLYQLGEYGRSATDAKNNGFYLGSASRISENDPDYFVYSKQGNVNIDGKTNVPNKGFWTAGMVGNDTQYLYGTDFYNMRTGAAHPNQVFLSIAVAERFFNDDFFAQSVIINNAFVPPFWCAIPAQYSDMETRTDYIQGRPVLRYANKTGRAYRDRVLYIPLDYWEL